MRHATEPPCDKSQSYLIGAGGVRGVCHAGCGLCALTRARALRGVICAPTARERRQSRPQRSRPLQRAEVGVVPGLPQGRGSLRFRSKAVPERGRRALRRRSRECSVALQELPQNDGHSLVIFNRERAYTRAFSIFYFVSYRAIPSPAYLTSSFMRGYYLLFSSKTLRLESWEIGQRNRSERRDCVRPN